MILALAQLIFFFFQADAFPTTIRHGYSSCFTCHYSPTGGGVLRPYGRIVAGELYGAFNDSESALPWLKAPDANEEYAISLMARGVQTHYEDEFVKKGDFRRMQFDIEGGVLFGKAFAFLTAGLRGDAAGVDQQDTDIFVRRFFAGVNMDDYVVRLGRFLPEFGIRHPNHNIATRSGLYFNQGQEPLNLQGYYYLENFDIAASVLQGYEETAFADRNGHSLAVVYKTDSNRVGVSYLNLSDSDVTDSAVSLYTQLGYGPGYTLVEFAMREIDSGGAKNKSELGYLESGWEVARGIVPFIGYDHRGVISSSTFSKGTFVGLSFYPITHFETRMQYTSLNSENSSGSTNATLAFFMINAYF